MNPAQEGVVIGRIGARLYRMFWAPGVGPWLSVTCEGFNVALVGKDSIAVHLAFWERRFPEFCQQARTLLAQLEEVE